VASYLTIPEITDSEDLLSLTMGADGLTVETVIAGGDTSIRLQRASNAGELIPLVVVTTDAVTLALDEVYVTRVDTASHEGVPHAAVSFQARAVRRF
jgi:hypothetical protein